MRAHLYKSAAAAFLLAILAASSYQLAQPAAQAATCNIDRNCASQCRYCRSVQGANDPTCEDYEWYTSLDMCLRDRCEVTCTQPDCTQTDGYLNCNTGCSNACGNYLDPNHPSTRCPQDAGHPGGGTVVGTVCSSATSSCANCTCYYQCFAY